MKKGSYGSLESVSTNKYILRLMSDMKKLYMCNLEKVILFNITDNNSSLCPYSCFEFVGANFC